MEDHVIPLGAIRVSIEKGKPGTEIPEFDDLGYRAIEGLKKIENSTRGVRGSLRGKGERGETWFCLPSFQDMLKEISIPGTEIQPENGCKTPWHQMGAFAETLLVDPRVIPRYLAG